MADQVAVAPRTLRAVRVTGRTATRQAPRGIDHEPRSARRRDLEPDQPGRLRPVSQAAGPSRDTAMSGRPLTCRDVVELATEYFEASLPPEHSARFAAHVAACRGCQTYLRQLRITVDIVHTVADGASADISALRSAFRRWRGTDDADVDSS
jgi:hypothetical protein